MSEYTINLNNNTNGGELNSQFDNNLTPENFYKHVQDLVAQKTDAMPFPIDVFPEKVKNIIEATKKCLGFPVDFTGASMLFATSIAIGNSFKIKVNEKWLSNAVVYIALIGRPGTNKSHPLQFALAPIKNFDRQAYMEYEKEKINFTKAMNPSKRRKPEVNDDLEMPILKQHIVSDITLESLTTVHKYNKRGLGACVDELAGWFKNFNRYNKGSEQEFWLSNWSGVDIVIDRKSDEPIRIPFPFISVCGTIQTSILDEMAKDNRNLNGFIDRILTVIPEYLKVPTWSDVKLEKKYVDNWDEIILNLLGIQPKSDLSGNPIGQVLDFNQNAWNIIKRWQAKNAEICNTTENESLAGTYVKLEIYCVRFALILQALYFACGEEPISNIGEKAVKGAIKLAEYFRYSATKVNSILTYSKPLDRCPSNKQRLYKALPEIFKTKEAIKLSEQYSMAESTVKRFINDPKLFRHLSHGSYEKIL
jgi:hypothetical protein